MFAQPPAPTNALASPTPPSGFEPATLLSASGVLTAVTILVAMGAIALAFVVYWRIRHLRRDADGGRASNPVRGLLGLLVVALLLLVGSVLASTRPRSHVREDAEALNWFRGEAMMLDERLTMSARLAASSGDRRWEERYRAAERDLDAALKHSDDLLDRLLGSDAALARGSVEQTSEYNDALIALEDRCFQRVAAGDRDGAMAAVMSDEYERLKGLYKSAVAASDSEITRLVNRSIEHNERWAVAAGVLGVLSAGVMVCGTLLLALALARHSRALAQRNVELLDARARADSANQSKSEFLANMSHEIRTPVAAILGFADLLHEDDSSSEIQRAESVDTIRRAARHLLAVINDILDISKIEAGRMNVEMIETSLPGMMAEVESLLRPRAVGKGLALATTLDTPVPERVITDPTRLRQILMNLAGNAVKFTECGHVAMHVRVIDEPDRLRLQVDVEDSGPGIDAEQASRLFTPFTQGDATVTRRFGGTGLGLIICRRLAHLMGGDVTLDRSEVGVGSRFRLDIPIDPAPGTQRTQTITHLEAPPDEEEVPTALHGRILLAEDGPDNRKLILFHLRKAGAEVVAAENGREALAMLEQSAHDSTGFDVLLTDMQMPELDGYALARTLRRAGNPIPIIALTAHAMADDRQRCIDAGCDDYLSKPIDRAALLRSCHRWIEKAVSRAERRAA